MLTIHLAVVYILNLLIILLAQGNLLSNFALR